MREKVASLKPETRNRKQMINKKREYMKPISLSTSSKLLALKLLIMKHNAGLTIHPSKFMAA